MSGICQNEEAKPSKQAREFEKTLRVLASTKGFIGLLGSLECVGFARGKSKIVQTMIYLNYEKTL